MELKVKSSVLPLTFDLSLTSLVIVPSGCPPPYEPGVPEPTTRADLMKCRYQVVLWGGSGDLCSPPRLAPPLPGRQDGPEAAVDLRGRGQSGPLLGRRVSVPQQAGAVRALAAGESPRGAQWGGSVTKGNSVKLCAQVLCKESLLGRRAYWEVEYGGWVVVGLVCQSAPRHPRGGPCGLGENDGSWGAGWSGSCYQAWHNGESVDVRLPHTSTIGVYVDQPAGVLNFLLVEGGGVKEVQLLHRFKVTINENVYPGFWVGEDSFCLIRKKEP